METLKTIRPELLLLTRDQLAVLSPYLWVFFGTILTMLLSLTRVFDPKWPVFIVSVATTAAGVFYAVGVLPWETHLLFNDMMVSDTFSNVFNVIFLASAGLTLLASFRYLDREKLQYSEYYILILFSALGMMLMTSSLDLIVTFIALEIMSLAVYILVGFRRADRRSNEGAMKYFILGSAASAVLLYGAALLYGATGSTSIRVIGRFVQTHPDASPLFVVGAALVVIGFLFKVASVPFHMWMPDVYEGAPTPVTGFMTTGLKAAAFGAFLRVFISLGLGKGLSTLIETHFRDILWVSAVLTMVFGNVVALTQTNLKRMLAYSSISHTGYILIGLFVGAKTSQGYSGVVFYLVSYALMNLGAFAVMSALATRDDGGLNLHDMSGLSQRHPWLAFSMAVFLFSMAGVPPTAGFYAKYLLFYSAIEAGEISVVVIGVLCSAISVYYYLRVLVYMYMRDPVGSPSNSRVSAWSALAVASMVFLTLQIGALPARLAHVAQKAVNSL